MRAKVIIIALSAYVAFGQDTARVFHLQHIVTEPELNDLVTLVRTPPIFRWCPGGQHAKDSFVGPRNASQIAIAEFLFTELDRQTVPDSVSQEFRVSNSTDDIVRLFFVPNAGTVQSFQEIATTVRTIAEIRRLLLHHNTPRRWPCGEPPIRSRSQPSWFGNWISQPTRNEPIPANIKWSIPPITEKPRCACSICPIPQPSSNSRK